ncbi:hypothetical protein U8Q06_34925 (plasmid) [Rhizobium beringeri]|uniref:hypothetical protein n=1 Tax=Rhizobium beringeri TaxID=3019934 RepID=UPI002E162870|nr:hypothetical protein U8Q06_34925 [Rhizobium beringeri]
MTRFLKSLLVAFSFVCAGATFANAADVRLSITNASAKTIIVDAVPLCTNCTTSSATSISAGGFGVSTATADSGATLMSYSIDYSNYFGTNFTEKGCRASITVELTGGVITNIVSWYWGTYTGNPSCTNISSPQIAAGGARINWSVRFNAS